MRFRNAFYRLTPSWLNTGEGELVFYSLGLVMDGFAERMRLSHEADMPERAPEDALAYLGRDRGIRRGVNEPAASYALRLIPFLDDLRTKGNPYALMDQLHAFIGKTGVTIRTVDRRGNWYTRAADGPRSAVIDVGNWEWDATPASPQWARFWVVIFGAWELQWSPTTLGARSGTTTATKDEIAGVMAIIADWKPAGTRCDWVIITEANPATTYHPEGSDVVTGTWGQWGDNAAPGRPVRNANARYWRGPR